MLGREKRVITFLLKTLQDTRDKLDKAFNKAERSGQFYEELREEVKDMLKDIPSLELEATKQLYALEAEAAQHRTKLKQRPRTWFNKLEGKADL